MHKKRQGPETEPRPRRRLPRIAGSAALVVATSLTTGVVMSGRDSDQRAAAPTSSTPNTLPPTTTTPAPTTTAESLKPDLARLEADLERARQDAVKQQAQIDLLSQVLADQAQVSIETVKGNLPKPETLPAYGHQVSPEARTDFEDSTVRIGQRTKGDTTSGYGEICTANKVTYQGADYIMTAAHCFNTYNSYAPADAGPDTKFIAGYTLDITEAAPYEYVILDPNKSAMDREAAPVASVNRVLVNYNGFDVALMSANPTPEFEAIRAIPAESYGQSFDIGQDVALNAASGASNNELIDPQYRTGTYLGRVSGESVAGISTYVDVVGLKNIPVTNVDECMYGASGSSALLADSATLGPLSQRHQIQTYDDGTFDSAETREMATIRTLKYEDALHLDLSEYDTICGYTTIDTAEFGNMITNAVPGIVPAYGVMH